MLLASGVLSLADEGLRVWRRVTPRLSLISESEIANGITPTMKDHTLLLDVRSPHSENILFF